MSKVESVESVVSHDGTTIAYEQSGAGPALILIGPQFAARAVATADAEVTRCRRSMKVASG